MAFSDLPSPTLPSVRPPVLVILLNYRGWRDTIACLNSLQGLRYPAWDVLVVDNASPDDSVARIHEAFPQVEVLQTERNLGFGGGNNRGIKVAFERGYEYVWLLNNDTTVEAETVTALMDGMDSDPHIGAIGSVIFSMDAPTRILAWGGGRFYINFGHARQGRSAQQQLSFVTGASLLLRVSALRQVGQFDERYFFLWEDLDLSLRLIDAGWRIAVAEKSRVWHKDGGTEPITSPFRLEHHARGLVLTLRKHARFPQLSALPMLGYYLFLACQRHSLATLGSAFRGWRQGWQIPL